MFLPLLLLTFLCTSGRAQNMRWDINEKQNGVVWDVANETRLPHGDNVEMSGRGVSMVVAYKIDTNRMVTVQRRIIYPQMRPFIKDNDPNWWATYRNYLRRNYEDKEVLPKIYVGDKEMTLPPVQRVLLNGTLTIVHERHANGLLVEREFFPSTDKHQTFERLYFTTDSEDAISFKVMYKDICEEHLGAAGNWETCTFISPSSARAHSVKKGEVTVVDIIQEATRVEEELPTTDWEELADQSYDRRIELQAALQANLVLETPEPIYNTMFSLAKIRGAESIFDSKLGLVHSPGGERYYIGFWANDQAEYINPFFPYLGYKLGNDAALNMWRVYQRAIPEDGSNIRYAFEMEGDSPANPLDRGDAAMIAYGLSHYLLALGDEAIAEELWPLLTWCLDYNAKMLNEHGVVSSESDEMEGRIETGDANLSTSSLYFGALETSISLALAMGGDKAKLTEDWRKQRANLAVAIEQFFGARVEGLATYRYFDGHENLRHWIALPLVVGLHDRKDATLEGLFDRLWTDNGIHVEKSHPNPVNSKIFWDRGTLYALRGAFIAGATERAHDRLLQFSQERLLGERVPYVVEAYPEGSMAHLSAESGLYCRVFTEGLFGMLPTGFRTFRLQPRMPKGWKEMALRNVFAFGQEQGFDVEVSCTGTKLMIQVKGSLAGDVIYRKEIREGETVEVSFTK